TPRSDAGSAGRESPFGTPALLRLGEHALRERLREAYGLLKEKERNLFLAATVGQELVDANQQLQSSHEELRRELAQAQLQLHETGRGQDDDLAARLHGRRRSMHMQSAADQHGSAGDESEGAAGDRERQWMKTHVQPLRAQLQMAQERTDELLTEREEQGAETFGLRQELAAALRRAGESAAAASEAQRRADQLAGDNARLQSEVGEQRAFWARRWAEHQEECRTGELALDVQRSAERSAEDAAARIRAEQRAGDLQARCNAALAESELLRSRVLGMEEERTSEWEPLRARWLASEEALGELQEAHQSACEALAQAEARLAELDKGALLDDPIKARSEKTSTSLLGELDLQRHKAVSEQRALAREHTVLRRAYGRALNSQSRMKQQVARLTQLAATGASEARMRRLEAALGEAECQQQVLMWASAEQRRPADADISTGPGNAEMDGSALAIALRARLRQATADRDQAQRELRTAHLLRANEIQKSKDLERDAADAEARLRRAAAELASLRADNELLKRAVRTARKAHPAAGPADEMAPGSPTAQRCDADDGPVAAAPPRIRTGSGAGSGSGRSPPRSGPKRLNFTARAGPGAPESDQPPLPGSPDSRTAKRRRVQDDAGAGAPEGADSGATESKAQPAEDAQGPAALGGAASPAEGPCLGAAGAGHASAMDVDATAEQTREMPSRGARARQDQAEADAEVAEIHVGGGLAQRPMECNNQ
ncbi:hypothetical protein LPJ61_001879, partial [Coemansia biformis]